MHGAPEREGQLDRVARPDAARALAALDPPGQQLPGGDGGIAQRRMVAAAHGRPAHQPVVRRVGGGEPDERDRHRPERGDGVPSMRPCGPGDGVPELAKSVLRDRGEERALVGKVAVGRRLGHARAPRGAAQRHAERTVCLEERGRRRHERGVQVAVMVGGAAAGGRCGPAAHVVPS